MINKEAENLRVAGVGRGAAVTILVDGQPLPAHAGEMLAAALMAGGIRSLRLSPRTGKPRGAFCLMGSCQECLVLVDGRQALACRETVRDGLRVELGHD